MQSKDRLSILLVKFSLLCCSNFTIGGCAIMDKFDKIATALKLVWEWNVPIVAFAVVAIVAWSYKSSKPPPMADYTAIIEEMAPIFEREAGAKRLEAEAERGPLFEASSAQDKDRIVLTIGERAKAFHTGLNGKIIEAWWPPSNEHDVFFMEDLLEASGLKKDVLMLEANVDNAYALVDFNGYGEPFRRIIYNVNWLAAVHRPRAHDDVWYFVRFFVIGHEIGHHVCKHTAGRLNGLLGTRSLRQTALLVQASETSAINKCGAFHILTCRSYCGPLRVFFQMPIQALRTLLSACG